MSITIAFAPQQLPEGGDLAVLSGKEIRLPAGLASAAPDLEALLQRVAGIERFGGKVGAALTVPAPAGLSVDRLHLLGTGPEGEATDWRRVGGVIAGRTGSRTCAVWIDDAAIAPDDAAQLALGASLRAYRFDRYKTKKTDEDRERDGAGRLVLLMADPAAAEAADVDRAAVSAGVDLARDLVNEPPNILFPAEFARRAQALESLGVAVEVMDQDKLGEIGMRALLAVGQGSTHGSRAAFMEWRGGPADAPTIAIIGKGVCFDSGGISIKPSGGMEDMKGDMAGAAVVVGLMHALAARKAKVNVVGAIGLTENMPDGEAQRPGDIITTLSGQTVEMVNSDAEGRLVLGDVLWYVQDRYRPSLMIDLATLTGAIIVALGQENAGLFSNDDALASQLVEAGRSTGETVWRMPLGVAYDKMIDSKFADMKNTGGRHGGAITAAQFLQRFVRDKLPWAHLDIAGTGIGAPQTDINKNWSSGWGVRLLDRFIRDHHER